MEGFLISYQMKTAPQRILFFETIKFRLENSRNGWGTRIRTRAARSRAESSTTKLSPTEWRYLYHILPTYSR